MKEVPSRVVVVRRAPPNDAGRQVSLDNQGGESSCLFSVVLLFVPSFLQSRFRIYAQDRAVPRHYHHSRPGLVDEEAIVIELLVVDWVR